MTLTVFCQKFNNDYYSRTRNCCKSSAARNAHDYVIVLVGCLARLYPLICHVYSEHTSFFELFPCLAIGKKSGFLWKTGKNWMNWLSSFRVKSHPDAEMAFYNGFYR